MNTTHKLIEALESRIAPAAVFAVEADTNKLVSFDSATPGTLLTDQLITGLAAGEVVVGIDIENMNGTMFAMALKDDGATRSGHYYTIDPATAVATEFMDIENPSGLPDSSAVGFEIRETAFHRTTADDVYRFSYPGGISSGSTIDNPTGTENVTAIAMGDIFGFVPIVYAYNFATDEFAKLEHIPNTSKEELIPIGHANIGGTNIVSNSSHMGFDIAGSPVGPEQAYMSYYRSSVGTHFYSVNLSNAAMTDLGAIGDGNRFFTGLTVSVVDPAPAIAGNKATWTDADGDTITLTVSKGTLTAGNFHMLDAGEGSFLGRLTLGDDFDGANLSITAKAGPHGDGQLAMGQIHADTITLGNVKVGGVISQIVVGDNAKPGPSVKSLTISGIERALYGEEGSTLHHGAGSLHITGDFTGGIDLGSGKTGAVIVNGDMVRAYIGSPLAHIESVTVKGSMIGATVGGESGGTVKVGGSVVNGEHDFLSRINFQLKGFKTLTIAGSLAGGKIESAGVTSIKIGGNFAGYSGPNTGGIDVRSGTLKSLSIGGSIQAAGGASDPLIISAGRIGSLTVKGSVTGTEVSQVRITATGIDQPATQADATAIGKITIGGSLTLAHIGAGMDTNFNGVRADAAIGAVKIGGSMIASSVTVGIDIGSGIVGDADDAFGGGNSGNAGIIARIASITIGSTLRGTAGGAADGAPDSFGIIAEQIGALTIGKTKVPLTAAKDDLILGFTSDVRVREL